MVSEDRIKELRWQYGLAYGEFFLEFLDEEFKRFAQAIEAECAKVLEGYALVPLIVTPAIEAVYANDSGAYGTAQELHDAMLAAASQPAPFNPDWKVPPDLAAEVEQLKAALKNVREWFESESKSISKGNGSQWSKLQCDEQIATIDEVLK